MKHKKSKGIKGTWLTPEVNARYNHFRKNDLTIAYAVYQRWANELKGIIKV